MVASTAARKEITTGSFKFPVKKHRPKHFSVWQSDFAPTPFRLSNEHSILRPIRLTRIHHHTYLRLKQRTNVVPKPNEKGFHMGNSPV